VTASSVGEEDDPLPVFDSPEPEPEPEIEKVNTSTMV
jgi:hypothetical protein